MVSINEYFLIEAIVYIIIFSILYINNKKGTVFDIQQMPSLNAFVIRIVMVILLGCIAFEVKSLRYSVYADNLLWKNILFYLQGIIGISFETILIASWSQCFYQYFRRKYWIAILIFLWVFVQIMFTILNVFLFITYTFLCIKIIRNITKNIQD